MVLERLAPVPLFDVRLVAIARDAEDLVIVLRLAALERRLGSLELAPERAHVSARALRLGPFERGAEVRDRFVVPFVVQPDARAGAERFERVRLEDEGGFGVDERVVVAGELRGNVQGQLGGEMRWGGHYFNQGRGAVRQQRRAQLAALSFVLVFADALGGGKSRMSDFGGIKSLQRMKRASSASVYSLSASSSLPDLNAWLPSSFNRSTSLTRFRRRRAGSWPGSNRSAD
jgi:hypothetical protein